MVRALSPAESPGLGKGPPYGTRDGRHLHEWVNLALFNLMLNLARRAREGQGGARATPAGRTTADSAATTTMAPVGPRSGAGTVDHRWGAWCAPHCSTSSAAPLRRRDSLLPLKPGEFPSFWG
jgi:hypothetical protein